MNKNHNMTATLNIPLPGESLKTFESTIATSPLCSSILSSKSNSKATTGSTTTTTSFHDVYKLGEKITEGCFGVVYKAHHLQTQEVVAVKVIDRSIDDEETDEEMIHETSILRDLQNVSNVIQLIDFYMDEEHMYVVQTLANGGDVFDQVEAGVYNENDAKQLIHVLLKTIQTLHEQYNMVHRDIKPENLLLLDDAKDYKSSMQLCDFGYAKYLATDESLTQRCGTPHYIAPEIVNGESYGYGVDMWAIGVTLYYLLCGYQPFDGYSEFDLYENIASGEYSSLDDPEWESISLEAKQLIANLLVVDQSQRWTVTQALQCDWFNDICCNEIQNNKQKEEVKEELKEEDASTTDCELFIVDDKDDDECSSTTSMGSSSSTSLTAETENVISFDSAIDEQAEDENIENEEEVQFFSSSFSYHQHGKEQAFTCCWDDDKNDDNNSLEVDDAIPLPLSSAGSASRSSPCTAASAHLQMTPLSKTFGAKMMALSGGRKNTPKNYNNKNNNNINKTNKWFIPSSSPFKNKSKKNTNTSENSKTVINNNGMMKMKNIHNNIVISNPFKKAFTNHKSSSSFVRNNNKNMVALKNTSKKIQSWWNDNVIATHYPTKSNNKQ